jgi:cytochrome P450/NADPH-cytochrome P450 reductase
MLLSGLPYSNAVIHEVLRHRPPIAVVVRSPVDDIILPSTRTFVPAGTGIEILIYALHRDPKVWGDGAEDFRPERWLDDPDFATRVQEGCSWMPFGAGKRGCIGKEFAMLELALGAALMVRNFVISLPSDEPEPVGLMVIVVKTQKPIRFKLTIRR